MEAILQSGMVTKGRYLRAFEDAVREHLGVRHAVAVSSCTSGLMLTYRGLGLTGDVVVPSFTFMATVAALVWSGLRPVYADVDPETTNLDPAAAEAAITPEHFRHCGGAQLRQPGCRGRAGRHRPQTG